jgi:aminoglycoside phosphotransferase (APT) family kinase protein
VSTATGIDDNREVSTSGRWQRVERLDAGQIAQAVEEQSGVRLVVEGLCAGGQVGAAYVRWPDGHRSVLKWRPGTKLAEMQNGPIAVSEALRAMGYPAPSTELAVQIGEAVATVQELLPGTTLGGLDEHGLEQALALNKLQQDALADLPGIPHLPLYLTTDGPGFCLHEPLRQHSKRTAALNDRITKIGAALPTRLPGQDAVHVDFHPGNLLAVDGKITGVIDWDGAGRGDRRLDLVTLRFGLHFGPQQPSVLAKLDDLIDGFPDDIMQATWAHMSLRMVDWAIRHFTPTDVDHWLDLAEQRV